MKKFLFMFLVLAFCCVGFVGCGGKSKPTSIKFMVEDQQYHIIETKGNQVITLPEEPSKDNYTFEGWFFDKDVWENELTENTYESIKLSENVIVYARFECQHLVYNVVDVISPTCTEDGYTLYNCEICTENFKSDIVESPGHSLTELEVVYPTCTEVGYTLNECSVCFEEVKTNIEEAYGHNTYKEVHEPTCQTDGYTYNYCYNCQTEFNDNIVSKVDHIFEDYYSDNNATCSEDGTKTAQCKFYCGTTDTIVDKGSMNGLHIYDEEGICSHCGDVQPYYSKGLEYTDYGNYYALTGMGTCTDATVIVPEIYNNKFVEYISDFSNNTKLKNIVIPKTVTYIRSFSGCSNLVSVTLPENDSLSFGTGVFKNCTSLKSINLPKGVKEIGWSMFEGCSNLTTVTMTDSVKSIEINAFKGCKLLANISLPNSITHIKQYAFQGCSSLTSIKVPSGAVLDGEVFPGCSSLTSIELPINYEGFDDSYDQHFGAIFGCTEEVSKDYVAENIAGGLYTPWGAYKYFFVPYSLKTVIINGGTNILPKFFYNCPKIEVVEIGSSVTKIDYNAFEKCPNLKNVKFSEGLKTIGNNAFVNCNNIRSISLPNTLTTIGKYAFAGLNKLTNLVIPNSVTSIDEYALNNCTSLNSLTIPFIGLSKEANKGYDQVFGWIFGYNFTSSNQNNDGGICQYTYKASSSKTYYYYYYIPTSLKSVKVGENIHKNAFMGCSMLTSIEVVDATLIGEKAFYGCNSLTTLKLPNTITSIGDYALGGTDSLTSFEIPESVVTLGARIFNDSDITYVIINNTDLVINSANIGLYCDNLVILFKGTSNDWYNRTTDLNGKFMVYIYSETQVSGLYWHYVNNVPTLW